MSDELLSADDAGAEWISTSDLMAALMIVFLFIAIVYIRPLAMEREKVKEIAVAWQEGETAIHEALDNEFKDDLEDWGAEIEKATLIVRFKAPEILFKSNAGTLQPRFRVILDEFFPRYVKVLSPYNIDIDEIRIEGHTSSEWSGLSERDAYFRNMALSQERTRSVLQYVLRPGAIDNEPTWLIDKVTANGFCLLYTSDAADE